MKKIILPLIALSLTFFSLAAIVPPVQAQSSPPQSPDEAWQPPLEGGENIAPSVGVEAYSQTWPGLQMAPPSPVAPGLDSSIINAYLVNSRGQILNNLFANDLVYLVISFNGPGYFYLWEYYPSGSSLYGHWLCYRWYRPYAGIWRIGPFAPQSGDPMGRYVWKMWLLSNYSWSTRTLSFDYVRGYYPPDIPRTIPPTYYPPVINSFSTNMPSIELGQTATLTWTTSNASTVSISPGVGTVAASGSTTVSPTASTSYTLTATGNTGSPVSSSLTVTVMPRIPPTLSIDRPTIQRGDSATLSWSAPAATQVYISGVGNSGPMGTAVVTPEQTATYSLTASYIDGTTLTASATLNVEQPPYLLYGLIALLALAVVVIIVLAVRRPARVLQPQQAGSRAATKPAEATAPAAVTEPSEATTPAGTTPVTTNLLEASAARLVLPDGGELLLAGNERPLGRRDFNKLLKPDTASYISRQHIKIWHEDGSYYIEDAGSTNGTTLNGSEIKGTGRHALADGDAVELAGKLAITFRQ